MKEIIEINIEKVVINKEYQCPNCNQKLYKNKCFNCKLQIEYKPV